MDWQPPPRPRWVDRLNGHADHAGHARLLVPLEPDELVAAATESAGLDDFGRPGEFGDSGAGGAGWRTHFETFMEALEREGNFTSPAGFSPAPTFWPRCATGWNSSICGGAGPTSASSRSTGPWW